MADDPHLTAFRSVPRTGVIFVTSEATKLGFSSANPDWCNLGQVPGEFFDVNPGKRRSGRVSRYTDHVRFSFGPAMSVLDRATERLEALVAEHTR